MLKELKILNGNLDLEFNEYTYEYTVAVDAAIDKLEFEYKLDESANISITNNTILGDETIVYLDVYNINEEVTYTFYVYKENTNLVSGIDNYKKSLEVNASNELSLYKVQILTGSIFLVLIILFSIIFKRKRT